METNLDNLKKQLKIYKIIKLLCIILFLPLLLLIGITAPKSTALATIITVLEIIVIITGLILDKKTKELKTLIFDLVKIRMAIENKEQEEQIIENKYKLKQQTITEKEKYFFNILKKNFGEQYEIRPQVPLCTIIEKEKNYRYQYQNELNRIIDFGIFEKETTKPLLLIEINDRTHLENKRKTRDIKVKQICKNANIKLITFWTTYKNSEEYITETIRKNLVKDSEN